jgi:uncharacterized protein YceK
MIHRFVVVFAVAALILLTGCSQTRKKGYTFEPDKSVISGTLTTEEMEGEKPYIFILDSPIDVVSATEQHEEGDYNTTQTGVTKVQLTSTHGISFPALKDKKLKLTGTFFGAATAHHHTAVLMDVESFEELTK